MSDDEPPFFPAEPFAGPYVPLADGRFAQVYELTGGRARLGVSRPHEVGLFYDEEW